MLPINPGFVSTVDLKESDKLHDTTVDPKSAVKQETIDCRIKGLKKIFYCEEGRTATFVFDSEESANQAWKGIPYQAEKSILYRGYNLDPEFNPYDRPKNYICLGAITYPWISEKNHFSIKTEKEYFDQVPPMLQTYNALDTVQKVGIQRIKLDMEKHNLRFYVKYP